MYKYRFSIFTATFNRSKYLPEVYECLKKQTYKDFEWIIVDDGSTDETEVVCQSFVEEELFPIKYIKKKNGGKHTAWREGTKYFEGRYVLGADDDDVFPDDTLEVFDKYWTELEADPNYEMFWEIRARVEKEDGTTFTPILSPNPFDSDFNEINYKFKFNNREMEGCRKVEILKNEAAVPETFVFDEKCSNFPENIRWSRAARKYKTRFINDILRFYKRRDGESLTSHNVKFGEINKYTYNGIVYSLFVLNEQRDLLLKYRKIFYIKRIVSLALYQWILKRELISLINNYMDKLFVMLMAPPSGIIYVYKKYLSN